MKTMELAPFWMRGAATDLRMKALKARAAYRTEGMRAICDCYAIAVERAALLLEDDAAKLEAAMAAVLLQDMTPTEMGPPPA